ncbi:MAG: hypothetical protein V2G42_02155 [bacterium JZ-2024 1]
MEASLPTTAQTVGNLLAIFLTLGILTFLYKDNPLFRLCESLFAGVSVGYYVGVTIWQRTILAQVIRPIIQLTPEDVRNWSVDMPFAVRVARFITETTPGHNLWEKWHVLIPFLGGLLLFTPFIAPRFGWLVSLPFAFYLGRGAGAAVPVVIQASILKQMSGTIEPAFRYGTGAMPLQEFVNYVFVFVGLMAVLTYFYFSVEHKGVVGGIGRLGIWFVMMGFGAAFGMTVMARVSLLIGRILFLQSSPGPTLWLIAFVIFVLLVFQLRSRMRAPAPTGSASR